MAASTRSQVISLYKVMLKESSRFPSYNYSRTYALRRVRDAFRANREVEDPKAVERLMDEGEQMLALIQRQVSVTSAGLPVSVLVFSVGVRREL
uniref:Complex 1 LYR protein domain-containing protein n=1 Tax=Poecilia formosa TaxID=48698 RepID=A0A096MHC6_POEFO